MNTVTFTPPFVDKQVAELATYISSLRGDEEQALVKQVVPVIEAKNITEATNILVKESKTLLEAPEKGTCSLLSSSIGSATRSLG